MKNNWILKIKHTIVLFQSILSFSLIAGNSHGNSLTLILANNKEVIVEYTLDSYSKVDVATAQGLASILSINEGIPLLQKGAPDLQKIVSSIAIPSVGATQVVVLESTYTDYGNISIAPSKGNLKRSISPDAVPFTYDNAIYEKNDFYPGYLTSFSEPYVLRDTRGQAISVYPLQYNPSTKVLRFYNRIKIKISFESSLSLPSTIDADFHQLYANHFINYKQVGSTTPTIQYNPLLERGKMLIISHGPYMQAMAPFLKWKIQKGIPTEIVNVSTIGTNETDIKNYVQNYYQTNGLTYLLLVGDAAHIPPMMLSTGPSDNAYGYLVGNDSYPEIFVGRFSAESINNVKTQVNRTITYEKNPPIASWYKNAIGIASDQGQGIGDDNETDYEHQHNIRAKLLSYNYTNVAELYDGSQGWTDASGDPVPNDVKNLVENGCGLINYTGHGSATSIITTGFSTYNVDLLSNANRWPFIWSVGCVNGEFINYTCFAESWLRAQDGITGEPTGAIATLMSTINQTWAPPMDGQDEMNDILVQSYANNIKRTFGGLSMNGCMKMNDDYGPSGAEMTDTWNLFGDPSVEVRTDYPTPLSATHSASIPVGSIQLQLSCFANDAFASLVFQNQVIATTNLQNGSNTILFSSPLSTVDTLWVTVTGYNKVPYIGYVLVIPANGPFVTTLSYTLNDTTGNNNQLADYNEVININETFKNYGTATSNNAMAVLSSSDPFVSISSNASLLGDITSNSTLYQNNAFVFSIANNIPDQHVILFDVAISDSANNTWNVNKNIVVNAPKLKHSSAIQVNDPSGNANNIIDAGETVDLLFSTQNIGHSLSPIANAVLTCNSSYVSVNSSTYNLGIISPSTSIAGQFNVSISPSAPNGTPLVFYIQSVAGAYTVIDSFQVVVGQLVSSVLNEKTDFKFLLYPNPLEDQLKISSTYFNEIKKISVDIYDELGRMVFSQLFLNPHSVLTIDLLNKKPGVYFCKITLDGQVQKTEKISLIR